MLQFPTYSNLKPLIDLAIEEDMGVIKDDVTSRLLIDESLIGVGTLYQKEMGVVAGLPIVEMVCHTYDERLKVERIPGFHIDLIEGRFSDSQKTPLLRVRGPMRSLLAAERVFLNFMQRISGVATLTHRFVKRVAGTTAKIYDTRKTIPGHRLLDKYAVRAGGGFNHRIGLYDGLLVKDNHLAGRANSELVKFLSPIVGQCRKESATRLVEVEVDRIDQLTEVLKVDGIDVILLDNMDCPSMALAVEMRNKAGRKGQVELEASGGVNLETVRVIAGTGVDRIAIGALTHSAPALDISLDVELQ